MELVLLIVVVVLAGVAFWLRRSPRLRLPAMRVPTTGNTRTARWYADRGPRGYALLALIALIFGWLVLENLGFFSRGPTLPADAFVVRIAPFRSAGADARHGMIVAQQLQEALQTRVGTPMNLGVLNAPVTSPAEAAQLAGTHNIDVIIWGDVAAGTTAQQAGLRPMLHWHPSEPFVPQTWQGYDGHFVLPYDYDLALQNLNGPAVLGLLLDGINQFSRGEADKASAIFVQLDREYADVLRGELPSMLQGIIMWAEGRRSEAEGHFRAALEFAERPEHRNNLGAILLDQQQFDGARNELTRALGAAPELSQAHANLGRLFMDQGRPEASLPDLRSATAGLPRSPAVIASLGEALRRSGKLEDARTVFTTVLQLDPDNGPAMTELGMLALTPVTDTVKLEWELEQQQARSPEEIAAIRQRTEEGISMIEALRNEYLRQAAAYGAAIRPDMQRLAETQAAILEQEVLNRRYQLLLVQVEQGQVLGAQPRGRLAGFWDFFNFSPTPYQEAIGAATDMLKQQPSLPLQYETLYQQGRAAYLSNNPKRARQAWDDAIKLTETAPATSTLNARPEAHYGLARLAHDQRDDTQALAQLEAAIDADPRYFPAYEMLAQLDNTAQRWAEAVNRYRWLVTHRPNNVQFRLDLARALRSQGDSVGAEVELLPLANSGNVPALLQLSSLYREIGELDHADTAAQRALAIMPTNAAVHEELAAIALERNDVATAEAELRRSLELDPTRVTAHLALGRLYASRLNRPQDAAAQFRAAVNYETSDPLVHRQLGEVLLQIGQPAAALEAFQESLTLNPQSHEAQHGLASAYLALGRLDEARAAEERALAMANNNYTLAIVGLGDIAREKQQYDEAIRHYRAALERDHRLAIAYLGLGRVALAQGQPTIALSHFNEGLAIEPRNVRLLLGRGDALLRQNDLPGAQVAYRSAVAIDPGNAAAHAGLGNLLWKSGQTEAALVELNQATQLNPSDAETLLTVGEINASLDRNEAALDAYTKAADVNDTWHEPRYRRGVLLLKLEQTERAIADLEATVRLAPRFAQGHYWLGRAYRTAGRFANAQRQFQRAIELQGDYYEARYFLGRVQDELGNAPDAIGTYEAIIAAAPSGDPWRTEAARELDRIR